MVAFFATGSLQSQTFSNTTHRGFKLSFTYLKDTYYLRYHIQICVYSIIPMFSLPTHIWTLGMVCTTLESKNIEILRLKQLGQKKDKPEMWRKKCDATKPTNQGSCSLRHFNVHIVTFLWRCAA